LWAGPRRVAQHTYLTLPWALFLKKKKLATVQGNDFFSHCIRSFFFCDIIASEVENNLMPCSVSWKKRLMLMLIYYERKTLLFY
jgi:hypothetical protein